MCIKGMVMSSPVCCASPGFFDVNSEYFLEKNGGKGEKNERKCENEGNREESGESSSSSDLFESEVTEHSSSSSEDSSSIAARIRPFQKNEVSRLDKSNLEKKSSLTEMEMMKKKFAKLLLGEDMSGCGNGVSTALSISNAITNLCATLFGQIWRLEPLPAHKKLKWRREMEWLLSVSDHIVELTPCFQTFPDGTKLEVMKPRPRSDLYVNLPALRKLDNMLLDILDGFEETEFWYVDQGIIAQEEDGSSSFRKPQHPPPQEEKWWLPVPRVSTSGLTENARKQLKHRRDCTNQILKAAMAINSITLTDMEVPESYLETLPKNARANLGDLIYRYISCDEFSPECLLDCLDLSSEHQALEIANRVEASIYFWRRRASKTYNGTSNSKSSWEMVKDLVIDDAEKEELFADRAESLLLFLKRQFPGLPQTTLDMTKIQYNTDIGKSILESYSRVLESLAFNIVARIDDLLYVDELTRHSDRSVTIITKVGRNVVVADDTDTVVPVVVSSTPHNTAFTTPNISPLKRTTPAANKVVERSATPAENKLRHRGLGVRKVLTDFLNIDTNGSELDSPFKNET